MTRRFWADVWTVLRKEWLEWVVTPGWLLQPLVIIAAFGALVPLVAGRLWVEHPVVHWLWSWLPLLLSAGLVADMFAGERERDTLEALLASRLTDRAIIVGKVAAVVAYGWTITLLCGFIGWTVIWVRLGQSGLQGAPSLLVALTALSLLGALYVACVGVLISLRAHSVRQAQQLMSIAMVGSLIVAGLVVARVLVPDVDTQAGQMLILVGAVLAVLDGSLLLALLVHPRRSEWLIY